jgi:4'-phosphopantetheinyl transferase
MTSSPNATSYAGTFRTIDVWYLVAGAADSLLERAERILGDDECARAARFRDGDRREAYVLAHALLRLALSLEADGSPREWAFRRGAYGRPEIIAPSGTPRLRFSLSHTRGLTACAIGGDCDIGVDVEEIRHVHHPETIARRYFSAREAAKLSAGSRDVRRERFFEYWTLKEAYSKARGLGLFLPLDAFWFDLSPQCAITVGFENGVDDDARAWRFALVRPTDRHVLAAAVRKPPDQDVVFRAKDGLPLLRRTQKE